VNARDYHRRRTRQVFDVVRRSYERLAARHDVIVLEGAGSPAEVNLRDGDIVNMRMARAADASCLLVADIDRGGVFASLVGTFALLPPAERRRIRGFVVNRFRGDPSLFAPGVAFLERRLSRPCLGVVPYLRDLGLEEEDGVAVQDRRTVERFWPEESGRGRRLRVGVVALPRMANFTDFDALAAEPSVALAFVTRAGDLRRADVVIVPGSKETLEDLAWLKREGFAAALRAHIARRGIVIGVCGGLQMLGREIVDAAGLEGGGRARGLGLLGIRTSLGREKVTARARGAGWAHAFRPARGAGPARRLRIHLDDPLRRRHGAALPPHARRRSDRVADGARSTDGRVVGTYLHGLFDSDAFRHALVRALRSAAGLAPPALSPTTRPSVSSASTAWPRLRQASTSAHRGLAEDDVLTSSWVERAAARAGTPSHSAPAAASSSWPRRATKATPNGASASLVTAPIGRPRGEQSKRKVISRPCSRPSARARPLSSTA
jgi:adenosylcobyric acid synthase